MPQDSLTIVDNRMGQEYTLPITDGNWLYKERTGGPGEPEEETDAWCGVLPLRLVAGDPVTAPWSQGVAVPESVRRAAAQWVPTS